jgi:hypothetical protein
MTSAILKTKIAKTLFAGLLLLVAAVAPAAPLSPPIVNPANGHTYVLLNSHTWKRSEFEAVAMGGHLATVRNQAEEDWLLKTFGNYGGEQRLLWIGLSDTAQKFHFSWASGESVSYTCWAKGEPNNWGHGEDYVAIFYPNHSQRGRWNDWADRTDDPIGLPMNGVVEIIPPPAKRVITEISAPTPPPAPTPIVTIDPTLVVTNDSGSIKLQWSLSAADYSLQATTNLTEPFAMFGYSETTNLEAGLISVTITNPVPQMFFRLIKP